MWFRAAFAVAILCAFVVGDANAVVRISNDKGGQIGPYLDAFVSLRKSGQNVVIDGPCLSACTIVLGIVPRERICVTRRAQLGFHAAWNPGTNGRPILSQAGSINSTTRLPTAMVASSWKAPMLRKLAR